jgi:2-oxoglutarate/2-oxoacid ferredoxin oxidoreductase subunit beta
MLFGENRSKGLVLDGLSLKVVTIGEDGITKDDILIHDATTSNPILHLMLINMKAPEMPVAMGVIRKVTTDTYEELTENQISEAKENAKISCVDDLFASGDTWDVK